VKKWSGETLTEKRSQDKKGHKGFDSRGTTRVCNKSAEEKKEKGGKMHVEPTAYSVTNSIRGGGSAQEEREKKGMCERHRCVRSKKVKENGDPRRSTTEEKTGER